MKAPLFFFISLTCIILCSSRKKHNEEIFSEEDLLSELILPFNSSNIDTHGDVRKGFRRIVWSSPKADQQNMNKIGIFFQVGNIDLWKEFIIYSTTILSATQNQDFMVDFYIGTYSTTYEILEEMVNDIVQLQSKGKLGRVIAQNFRNGGADVGIFLKQLRVSHELHTKYLAALKFHSKSDPLWRHKTSQSLCGSIYQVQSIWNHFLHRKNMGILAPIGYGFGFKTPKNFIDINLQKTMGFKAFDLPTVVKLRSLLAYYFDDPKMSSEEFNKDFRSKAQIIAGTMFWFRYTDWNIEKLWDAHLKLGGFKQRYYTSSTGRLEHAFERFFPTASSYMKKSVEENGPAPLPIVRKVLRKMARLRCQLLSYHPEIATTYKKSDPVQKLGVYGFSFEYSWTSGHGSFLLNVKSSFVQGSTSPFILCWKNEESKEEKKKMTQLEKEENWNNHFDYLKPFLSHKNYITHKGDPILLIKRVDLVDDFPKMVEKWNQRIRSLNFKEILVIVCLEMPFVHHKATGSYALSHCLSPIPQDILESYVAPLNTKVNFMFINSRNASDQRYHARIFPQILQESYQNIPTFVGGGHLNPSHGGKPRPLTKDFQFPT